MRKTGTAILLAGAVLFCALHPAFAQSDGGDDQDLPPPAPIDEIDPDAGEASALAAGSETVLALDWTERHAPNTALKSHDATLLGDSIDLMSGRLTFEHVDVSLPGNSDLVVEVRRRLNPSQMQSGEFSDWQLAVPTISTKILADEWFAGNRWGKTRCSGTLQSALPSASWPTHWGGAAIPPSQYSDGVVLDVPGRTTGQVLNKTVAAGWPADAQKVTADGWQLKCISNIDGAGTEGFLAIAPNGDRYYFDVIVDSALRKSEFDIWQIGQSFPSGPPSINWKEMGVHYDTLGASEVIDVNGNWVRYYYGANGRLQTIESNDGRRIDITRTSPTARLIATVTANPGTADARQWTYTYGSKSVSSYKPPTVVNGAPGTRWETWGTLTTVTLPNGRQWLFDLANLQVRPVPGTSYSGGVCKQHTKSVSVTHPDGVTGAFTVEEFQLRLGAGGTNTNGAYCPNTDLGPPGSSQVSDVIAVTKKSLASPGLATAVWEYHYVDNGNEIITTIKQPGNSKQVVYHPTPFSWATPRAHAKLIKAELFPTLTASTPVEVRMYTYIQEGSAGTNFVLNSILDTYRPVHSLETTITRGSDWYKTLYGYVTNRSSSTYSYGFPTRIETWSSLGGGTRVTDITYLKDADDWILGLTDTVTRNGTPFDDFGYDTKGRLTSHSRFGITVATRGYFTSGTQAGRLNWHRDALARQTTFSSYFRGIPRTITRADSTTFTRTVDQNGWVKSETNPRGHTTGYQYDSVGRPTTIDRPSPWTDTTIAYSYSGGNLIQTATRGTQRTTTTHDAMLRPTRVRQQALSGGGGSVYVDTTYDALGRPTFTSLPSTSAGSSIGISTSYDALGRVTQARETASGGGTTNYAYLTGNKTRVTDPLGNITTTTSSGYGSPNDGRVVKVQKPVSITVDYSHDIHGNLTAISQAKGGGATHVSSFVYDGRQRLCRRKIPETGDTLYAYNNANEMTQYAEGQASGSACATPPTASRIVLSYDALGRLTTTNYPGTTPDIARTYDANGNLLTVNRSGVNWSYAYNSADLIGSETLTLDGRSYGIVNTYDNNERLTQRVFPSGDTYVYTNDGLGRPTGIQKGGISYVSSISWHPNGKIKLLTRGNGDVYDQQLNARQLTSFIGSTFGEDLNYVYDANGRVTQIDALANNAYDRSFTYDGAGRLKTASGPWGAGSYNYDPLGNLTKKTLGSQVVDIEYTSVNRVNRVRDTGVSTSWRNYSHDARGNVTADSIHGFGYDFANQPISVSGADSGSYVYDGNLKRVKQVVGGATIYSVYDRSGALLTRDNATAGAKTDYLSVGGQTFVRLRNGVATYPLNDHLGTALMVANQNGSIPAAQKYNYTPFGEAIGAGPGSANEQGFTGHVEDATGLTYMQARYYDPVIGRFLQTDPIGYEDQLNLYAYVHNDPVNKIDPNGELAFLAGCAANPACRGAVAFAAGAAVGTVVNATAQFVKTGEVNVNDALAAGAATGAVSAAVAVSPALAGNPAALSALGGTAAAVGSVAGDVANGRKVDPGNAIVSGLGGAVGTPAGTALLGGLTGDAAGAAVGEAVSATISVVVPVIADGVNQAIDSTSGVLSEGYQRFEDYREQSRCQTPQVEGGC